MRLLKMIPLIALMIGVFQLFTRSLANFIPEIWSARLLYNLHKAHVYGNAGVVNRDYEGEISAFGDTVRINAIGAITISDYTRNNDISAAQTVESAQTVLSIDQAKYFNFIVDDVDKAQIKPQVMDGAMWEAGYALADTTDTFIAALLSGNVATANVIASSGSPKTDLATDKVPYNYMVQAAQLLDQANVQQSGRWAIVPPWFYAYIRKDSNFLHATISGDVLLRMGLVAAGTQADMATPIGPGGGSGPTADTYVGKIAGFDVYMSNNVPSVNNATSYQIAFGHSSAWSFAEQLIEIEAYRPPLRFGDAVKGLHVYGGKVIRPQALVLLYANPT